MQCISQSPYMSKYLLTNDYSPDFKILDIYKRADQSFIQGFYYDDQKQQLIESVGQYKESRVQQLLLNLDTHLISPMLVKQYNPDYFGEGLTLLNDEQYLALTWLENQMLIIDRNTLEIVDERPMDSKIKQGWGLTHDDNFLYITEGSDKLFVLSKKTFEVLETIYVKDSDNKRIFNLNELQYVYFGNEEKGYIFANIFTKDVIIKIDIESGLVVKKYNFKILRDIQLQAQQEDNQYLRGYDHANNVLNGIAYDKKEDVFYLTGKRWNFIYKVKMQ